jgi:hypothetical protein
MTPHPNPLPQGEREFFLRFHPVTLIRRVKTLR